VLSKCDIAKQKLQDYFTLLQATELMFVLGILQNSVQSLQLIQFILVNCLFGQRSP